MLNRRGVTPLQPVSLAGIGNHAHGPAGSNPPSPARSGAISQAQQSNQPTSSISPLRRTPATRYKNSSENVAAVLGSSSTFTAPTPTRASGTGGLRGHSTPPTPNRAGIPPMSSSSLGGAALPGIGGSMGIAPNGQSNPLRNSASGNSALGAPSTPTNTAPLQYEFKVLSSSGRASQQPVQLSVGSGALQGHRPTMEDEHFNMINVATVEGQPISLFGILDGHCGRRVAELGSRFVPECFLAHPAIGQNNALALAESIVQADRNIFQVIGKSDGGSTLINAVVHGRMLFVSCLGDARAVLYDGTSTIAMSEDHKPSDVREQQRIVRCGGTVQFGRVCGCLAVSRALGDFEFKFTGTKFTNQRELMVSNLADVKQINVTDATKFLVLGCDGVWDVLSNEDATRFVIEYLKRIGPDRLRNASDVNRHLDECATRLADYAIERGSMDNVSVTIVFFHDVAQTIAQEPASTVSLVGTTGSLAQSGSVPHTPLGRGVGQSLASPYASSPPKGAMVGRTPLVGRR